MSGSGFPLVAILVAVIIIRLLETPNVRSFLRSLLPALATNKWAGSPTSRGSALTTELNSLGNGSYSGVGSAVDNTSNLDIWASLKITLASLSPTAGAYVQLFMVQAIDGTNYENEPKSTNPGGHMALRPIFIDTTGASAKHAEQPWFRIPPGKWKFVLLNGTGVALASSGNTVDLYTADEAVA